MKGLEKLYTEQPGMRFKRHQQDKQLRDFNFINSKKSIINQTLDSRCTKMLKGQSLVVSKKLSSKK